MIIVKMNNSTVECSIAASELREIGLTPESLMNGEQNSLSFMSQINKEVGAQLDYNPEQEVLLMSKNMMSDGTVRIFAVKMSNEDIQRTADRIREASLTMLSMVDPDKINELKSLPVEEKSEALGRLFMGVTEQVNHIYMPDERDEEPAEPSAMFRSFTESDRYAISFSSLRDAARFAKVVHAFPIENASLYKMDGVYTLFLSMPNDDDNRVFSFRKSGVEFADNMLVDSPTEQHIRENGECLIADDAVGRLARM